MDKEKIIVVFGASGKTGRVVVAEARKRGWEVRAVVRERGGIEEDGVEEMVWNYKEEGSLLKILKGVDGVIVVIGPRPPYKEVFCKEVTKKIVKTMKKMDVKRLICQTGAMIGEYPENRSFWFQLMCNAFKKQSPEGYQDRVGQEEVVIGSGLDWTIVKPSRLTDNQKVKELRVGEEVKIGMMSAVSRKNLVGLMMREVKESKYLKKIVFVKEREMMES